jgi:ABC-2 type transport system permease protein
MTKLLFINFIRSKGYLIGLLILLLSGLLSLHIGKRFLEKYDTTIDKTAHFQQETIDRYVNYVSDDLGLLLYYLRFGLVNEMPNITALSIGHRDVNPSIMNVTIRNLEEQKYNTDLINPMYQLLGNMDFSFVLIYLFPLVIIAFCFNLMSEEKEAGTWNLLRSQTKSPGRVMRVKMGIRLLAVSMVLLLILGIAKVYLAIEFDALFLAFSVSGILYIVFWFSLCWFVISLHKNSSQNALILLIAWLILTIVVPTTVNAVISHAYPVREAFETLVENRNSYHKKWDEPKAAYDSKIPSTLSPVFRHQS